jgi:hypothetical protein
MKAATPIAFNCLMGGCQPETMVLTYFQGNTRQFGMGDGIVVTVVADP